MIKYEIYGQTFLEAFRLHMHLNFIVALAFMIYKRKTFTATEYSKTNWIWNNSQRVLRNKRNVWFICIKQITFNGHSTQSKIALSLDINTLIRICAPNKWPQRSQCSQLVGGIFWGNYECHQEKWKRRLKNVLFWKIAVTSCGCSIYAFKHTNE